MIRAGLLAFDTAFRPTRFDLTEVKTFDDGNAVMHCTRSAPEE